ncbi:probable phytol kinase 2, chloroplastic [Triticum dicoccoides]|uniref:probable phytol kinase 2, chloroplastic n=1 Tax=Triticum dicoccoides TaxID=85692 RepID=UPI00188F2488|nr:probable phytol kinase 2, chloroplastic [Triticum dicoccoides]
MLCLGVHPFSPASSSPLHTCLLSRPLRSPAGAALTASSLVPPSVCCGCTAGRSRRATTMAAVFSPVGSSGLVQDLVSSGVASLICQDGWSMDHPGHPLATPLLVSSALTAGVAHGLFHFFQGLVERSVCDLGVLTAKPSMATWPTKSSFSLRLNRKLMHITIGMVPLLFWPLFSSGRYAPFLAALPSAINILRTLLLGLGIRKNEAVVKILSRSGDHREFLKAPLYYVTAIALATSVLWRTSPIAIALICNLCAGDGVADIVGRRLGKEKLPYNSNKSYAGSIAMVVAGFLASVGCMHCFHTFGFIEESWHMTFGFLVVSIAAALVESHPISTELDDNLTVPLPSFLVGSLIL